MSEVVRYVLNMTGGKIQEFYADNKTPSNLD